MSIFYDKYGRLSGWSDNVLPKIAGNANYFISVFGGILFVILTPVMTIILFNEKEGKYGVKYKNNWIAYLLLNVMWIFAAYLLISGNYNSFEKDYSIAPYEYWDWKDPNHKHNNLKDENL